MVTWVVLFVDGGECSLILIDFDQFYWLTMILNVLKANATVKKVSNINWIPFDF